MLRTLCLVLTLGVVVAIAADGPHRQRRTPWTTSRVTDSPEPPPKFKAVVAFPKIKFDHPLVITRLPGADRLYVGEQDGKIFSFENRPDATAELVGDLRKQLATVAKHPGAKELENLFCLVFHPKFPQVRECFVCYSLRGKKGEKNLEDGSRISRFKLTDTTPPKLDFASEEILLTFLQGGHNGCDMHFGPDGYLYFSTGDATDPAPPDVFHTGQDITDLLSSIQRIDVNKKDAGKNYAIPPDNPFVGTMIGTKPARGEVWAYGFRNPWRMGFDDATGNLWVGDVGWEQWESVHRIEKGGNYGWSLVEARQAINGNDKPGPTPVRPPVIELPHSDAASVTGGRVYRGKKFPELVGTYIFGDWETRRVWSAKLTASHELDTLTDLVHPTVRVITFGEDAAGELYFLDYDTGTVHALERNPQAGYDPAKFPRTLSATGIFADTKSATPAAGVERFDIAARTWHDHATTEYLMAFPGTSAATDYANKKMIPGNVNWHFFRLHLPKDGVLVKTLSLETEQGNPATRKRVETQLLHFDGETWRPYTYAWRDDQTDADLVPADGAEKEFTVRDSFYPTGVRHQTWSFASRAQCMQCHNSWAEYALGFTHDQLNRPVPGADGKPVNQLVRLTEAGLLNRVDKDDKPLPPYSADEAEKQLRLTDPTDAQAKLADRARAYLHANCAHCHRFGGGGSVDLELHTAADLPAKVFDIKASRGDYGLPDAKIIARGEPERSVLFYRMAKFGGGRMPHLGAELVDRDGLALIGKWIGEMTEAKPRVESPPWTQPEIEKQLTNCRSALAMSGRTVAAKPAERERVYAAAAKLPAGPVRDLFDGYLSAGGERKLGSNPRPKPILALTGDVKRGEALFAVPTLQCATCHKVAGKGGEVGPDLSDVGKKRTRENILESLLDPSRRVDQQFVAYQLRLHSGGAHTGLLIKKDSAGVVLRDAKGKDARAATDDIEALQPSRQSLMPDGLLRDLTPQQAADLLAYLVSRK